MFKVRSAHALTPSAFTTGPFPRACRVRCAAGPCPPASWSTSRSTIVCPPFDPAVRRLLVRRQQAADPLRVGGQLGLCLCWLRLELGFRKLPATVAAAAAAVAAVAVDQLRVLRHQYRMPLWWHGRFRPVWVQHTWEWRDAVLLRARADALPFSGGVYRGRWGRVGRLHSTQPAVR